MAYRGFRKRPVTQNSPYTWPAVLVGVFLVLAGLFILGYWAAFILQGGMTEGLWTVENNSYIIFHQAAEGITALLALIGGYGLLRGRHWGLATSLVALGALLYASLNALGFAVYALTELTPVLIGTLSAVLLSFVALRFGRR
jgi:hypothetical protein